MKLYLRGTLRLPAKGLSPFAHYISHQPASAIFQASFVTKLLLHEGAFPRILIDRGRIGRLHHA